jgi:hypothetical protein
VQVSVFTFPACTLAHIHTGEGFLDRVRSDKGAFKGWFDTCAALCDVADHQLKALFELATGTTGQASGAMQALQQGSIQQVQLPPPPSHHHQSTGALAPQPADMRQATVLLPVMGAAALKLAYAAFACVRLASTRVSTGGYAWYPWETPGAI